MDVAAVVELLLGVMTVVVDPLPTPTQKKDNVHYLLTVDCNVVLNVLTVFFENRKDVSCIENRYLTLLAVMPQKNSSISSRHLNPQLAFLWISLTMLIILIMIKGLRRVQFG